MKVDLCITKDLYNGYNKGLGNLPIEWFVESWLQATGVNDIAFTADEDERLILIHKPTDMRAVFTDKVMSWHKTGLKTGFTSPIHLFVDFEEGSVSFITYLPGRFYLSIKMRLDTFVRRIFNGLFVWNIRRQNRKRLKRAKRSQ